MRTYSLRFEIVGPLFSVPPLFMSMFVGRRIRGYRRSINDQWEGVRLVAGQMRSLGCCQFNLTPRGWPSSSNRAVLRSPREPAVGIFQCYTLVVLQHHQRQSKGKAWNDDKSSRK
jgi:hypothetical protein